MSNNHKLNIADLIEQIKKTKNISHTTINLRPDIIKTLNEDITRKLFSKHESYTETKK